MDKRKRRHVGDANCDKEGVGAKYPHTPAKSHQVCGFEDLQGARRATRVTYVVIKERPGAHVVGHSARPCMEEKIEDKDPRCRREEGAHEKGPRPSEHLAEALDGRVHQEDRDRRTCIPETLQPAYGAAVHPQLAQESHVHLLVKVHVGRPRQRCRVLMGPKLSVDDRRPDLKAEREEPEEYGKQAECARLAHRDDRPTAPGPTGSPEACHPPVVAESCRRLSTALTRLLGMRLKVRVLST